MQTLRYKVKTVIIRHPINGLGRDHSTDRPGNILWRRERESELMDDFENAEREEEPEEEKFESEELEGEESSGGSRSWLVIALVGVAALLVGALLGYVGRGEFGPEAQAAKATEQAQAALVITQAAANANIMQMLSQETRHYKGDPSAAVTIIEFSDYQ